MPESKQLFFSGTDSANQMRAIYQSTSAEERSFQSLPNEGRSQLTPRDHERNLKVKQLFEKIIPGVPIDADAPELRREPECMQTLVEGVMKKLNLVGHSWIHELKEAWPQIVNPEIARQTTPGKLENSILFVYVGSSTALFELRRTRLKEIETAVKKFAPEKNIRHVKLMVNSVDL